MTFQELKRAGRRSTDSMPTMRLALMGDCSTQLFALALRGQGVCSGVDLQVLDQDYDQIDSLIADSGSPLYAAQPQYILIHMCTEKLWEAFCSQPLQQRQHFAKTSCQQITARWDSLSLRTNARVLQADFPELDSCVFGSYRGVVIEDFLSQLRLLNVYLTQEASQRSNIFLLGFSSIQNRIGRDAFYDEKLYFSAKQALSFAALPLAAKASVDVILALEGRVKKCVVCDLDNTLWGGVIGDDGIAGIHLGELGTGRAYTALQLWLRELKNRGVLLTVCSKNDEATAKEPFLHHPDMILRLEDIALFTANWEDKASNISSMAKALNIGLDSMVFLDDNPFERQLVRSLLPAVTVPELPEDPACYLSYLQGLNLFETASFSQADLARTSQYQAEQSRQLLQQQFSTVEEYLQSLNMKAQCLPFDPFHYPRIAQLTQRSNQFNLRTIRYSENDIARLAHDPSYVARYFTLKDKLGDHGLVSIVILRHEGDALVLDTWIMSCRVLKRGMEEWVCNQLMEIARELGYARIEGQYLPTAKNTMVSDLLPRLGFTQAGDDRYWIDPLRYTPHNTFIEEERA